MNRPGHSLLHSSSLYPGAWYIDSALGIRTNPEEPGFRSIRIHPPKFDALSWQWAKGHFDAPTGRVAVDWKKSGGDTLTLAVTLPANTGGEVYVPSAGKDKTEAPQGAVGCGMRTATASSPSARVRSPSLGGSNGLPSGRDHKKRRPSSAFFCRLYIRSRE